MKLLIRLWYNLPKWKKDIWYNRACWTGHKYPIVFNYEKKYIPCKLGGVVQMGTTKKGLGIFYEIVKITNSRGSDFVHPSDSIDCDLKFSHIKKIK